VVLVGEIKKWKDEIGLVHDFMVTQNGALLAIVLEIHITKPARDTNDSPQILEL
jgi:hypothetical protein